MVDFISINSIPQQADFSSLITLVSGLLGAAIGGFATYKAVDKSHINNTVLEKEKEEKNEKNLILAINEELKVLKEAYEQELDTVLLNLKEDQYLTSYYTATQDFMTIYHGNANKIGYIKNKNLRNKIIKTYIFIKRYLEESLIYKKYLDNFYQNRQSFLATVYPNLVNGIFTNIKTAPEIAIIVESIGKNDWSWLKSQYINQEQVINFIKSDEQSFLQLIHLSKKIKQLYIQLKAEINSIIMIIESIYPEDNL